MSYPPAATIRTIRRCAKTSSGSASAPIARIWILPAVPNARETVRKVAARHGDQVVSFAPSRDRVHPQSEDALARDIDTAIARAGEAATGGG